MLGLSAKAFEDCKHQKTDAHEAQQVTLTRVEFNLSAPKIAQIYAFYPL
jgi:hypothetical protein